MSNTASQMLSAVNKIIATDMAQKIVSLKEDRGEMLKVIYASHNISCVCDWCVEYRIRNNA